MKKLILTLAVIAFTLLPLVVTNAAEDLALLAKPVARGPLAGESIYFVMTDRFANGDTANDKGGLIGSRSVTGFDSSDKAYYHGGDFKGLTEHLQYIKGLGFTSIWITPPVKNKYVQGNSAAYHGYWGIDFTTIDPHLGTEKDFKYFVAQAHELGMKVIVDIVVNHTADVITYPNGSTSYRDPEDYPYKNCQGKSIDINALAGSSKFPKLCANKSFAYIPSLTTANKNIKMPAFLNNVTNYHNRGDSIWSGTSVFDGDFFGLDDLFTENPEVVKGWSELWASWITKFDIDGYRVDTAKHVNPQFWKVFIPKILTVAKNAGKKEFPIFGEVAESNPLTLSTFVKEQKFQSVLDFGFQNSVTKFAVTGRGVEALAAYFNSDDLYTSSTTSAYSLATFLGNHDMGRIGKFISDSNQDPAEALNRASLANALLLTLRGSPILYYGDEKGFTGSGGDQLARQDFFPTLLPEWQREVRIGSAPIGTSGSFDNTNPLQQIVSQLNSLFRSEPALRRGTQQIRYANESVFAFSRYAEGQEFLIVANGANEVKSVKIPVSTLDSQWKVLLGSGTASGEGASVSVELPKLGWAILKAEKKYTSNSETKVTLHQPENEFSSDGWVMLSADIPGNDFNEVTFSARAPGSKWITVGTADRRTFDRDALYRVYLDGKIFKSGSKIEVVAVAKNPEGKTSVSKIAKWKL
ncbi:MAG: secreted alpha-amylase Amy [Actinomycetota bacterium]|jgi:glycosidase